MGLSQVQKAWAALQGNEKSVMSRNKTRKGPHEFAEALIADFRAKHDSSGTRWPESFPCSENGVRELAELAFYVSLLQEEGRALRFRGIFGCDNADLLPYAVIGKFASPLHIQEPSDLVKLAPALSSDNIGLWITETPNGAGDTGLYGIGLLDLEYNAEDFVIGFPDGFFGVMTSFSNRTRNNTTYFNLQVEGCGHLRASFAMYGEYTLRAGTITPYDFIAYAPPAGALFRDIGELFADELVRTHPQFDSSSPFLQVQTTVIALWARVLQRVVSRHHGGCFIVLPEHTTTIGSLRELYGVCDGYQIDLDVGKYLIDLLRASEALHQLEKTLSTPCDSNSLRELSRLQQNWSRRRHNLRVAITTLADLTSIDGCVVLDRHLRCYIFGAKLERRPGNHAGGSARRELRDWYSHASLEEAIKKLGKRNGSACDFCRDHPGALTFVVSQDTDLRLYCSDTQSAYGFENLSAG